MSASVVELRPSLYEAKCFLANGWQFSGTLCGGIDIATPSSGTYNVSPDEAQAMLIALAGARDDVLANSNPFGDPRLYYAKTERIVK